ncbi:acyl-CoA dehydrogenase [Sphingosinicella ginsenosidimutans]|uniref:Pimeloyl-CoA dehydrogenase small subunit n=1 Tax=Allosphingosinicella ginsenosidimutans TaxID=1176539 RepID=A0A5C6TQ01_9SPHN|nr:acyl-CoA dehydrogenase family protein [Sphingosinicella ginsenosidimutans]TXC62582.1 pimeloyl-CoA dehydrogenase small subunit [Sphingosinicella ginsenosidimutans]
MNFEPTEIQTLLRESAERLARDRFSYLDRLPAFTADVEAIDEDWAAIAELGVPGILVPEAYGGIGGTLHDIMPVLEVFGAACVFEPVTATAVVGAGLIDALGSAEQKARLLPQIAAGSLRVALASAERHSRYRLDHVETAASQGALTGVKTLVFGGATADLFIVSARDSDALLSLFLVPRNAAGLDIETWRNIDLSGSCDLTLTNVAAERLGEPADGLAELERATDRAIAALCSEAVGAMSALNEITLEHLRTRHAFGKPLGSFQVLQHRMVDMVVMTEQARSIAMLAADRAEADDPVASARAASAAKVQVGESGRYVGEQAVQLHGAIGITLEHPVSYFHKKLAVIDRLFGDVDHHLERYAVASGY